jgi:2-oxoglutarate/2-oxoacid ferredoxin oxidoreductase subunit alpha
VNRISLKVTGAQGQGVNSVGELCAKGLKRAGYCVFGYREYNSLIKGGHSSYQLDVSDEVVRSSEEAVDILVCFNHHGLELNALEVKDGGIILHQSPDWKFSADVEKTLKKRGISVICLPTDDFLTQLKAPPILGNILITSVVWTLFDRDPAMLRDMVKEQFGHKGERLVNMNFAAIELAEAWSKKAGIRPMWKGALPKAKAQWKDHLLLTGSQAMGLGIVHAGCRLYAGYPMTPSSPLLTYIADNQNHTGMIIKQAEDEITAVQMASGAMLMGTRAMTGTSGGGFDLMTETVSLNGIIENPCVIVLAQRPGPATGLPTWTAQGDLMLAIHAGHGEFARCVLSVSDSDDAFALMNEAFNIAEEYQTPVIVMTDKHIAEGIYTQKPYTGKADIKRGLLVTKPAELKKLKSTDRYDLHAEDGISPRWLPGSEAATYVAQGDEHSADGSVDESAHNAHGQMDKRLKKLEAMKKTLPEPELFRAVSGKPLAISTNDSDVDVLLVGWGSTKGAVMDVLTELTANRQSLSIGYLHYTYLWPLKTERFEKLAAKAKKVIFIEGNATGQLQMLMHQPAADCIRKYDGRPFFYNELHAHLAALLP